MNKAILTYNVETIAIRDYMTASFSQKVEALFFNQKMDSPSYKNREGIWPRTIYHYWCIEE